MGCLIPLRFLENNSNVMRLDFEPAYSDVTVKNVSYNATRSPPYEASVEILFDHGLYNILYFVNLMFIPDSDYLLGMSSWCNG